MYLIFRAILQCLEHICDELHLFLLLLCLLHSALGTLHQTLEPFAEAMKPVLDSMFSPVAHFLGDNRPFLSTLHHQL